jgi:DNA helicase-2/ATP-dependent DNA helicase PcrA
MSEVVREGLIIGFSPEEQVERKNEVITLDEEQTEVVDYQGSQMVVAGPGSGKTRVLTEKARRLYSAGKSILCICFTRAAASEMRTRIPNIPSTTIHAYCHGTVGWKDEWGYEGLLWRFRNSEDKTRYDWILIDECQDLNPIEFDIAMSLVEGHIFAVGDPHQSIYGFQGALGPTVSDLLKKNGCIEKVLHNNYRSSEKIVGKLNKIFERELVGKGPRDIGTSSILFRTNDVMFWVSGQLKKAGVPHTIVVSSSSDSDEKSRSVLGSSSLKLSTIHGAKGHEFDRVVLFDWYPDFKNDEEIRVYYVAMSRASKSFLEFSNIKDVLAFAEPYKKESSIMVFG